MNAFADECMRGAAIVALSLSLAACRQAKPFAEKVADNEEYIFRTMENSFPKLRKIGAVSPNGECSPFVWKGRLMRMELSDPTGALDADDPRVCIRILDTGTGEVLSTFGRDCYYPAAFVDGDRLLVTATKRTYWLRGETEPTSHCGESISLFESADLVHWTERTLFERPGWAFFNTSLARGSDGYVLAYECGFLENARNFTIFFATSRDLKDWTFLPYDWAFPKNRYSGGPFLVYRNGWHYLSIVTELPCERYCQYLFRTRDFSKWECGRYNPFVMWDDADRVVAPGAVGISPELARDVRTHFICSASDFEMCDFNGKAYANYLIGDQRGFYYTVGAWYDGSVQEFLERQFK